MKRNIRNMTGVLLSMAILGTAMTGCSQTIPNPESYAASASTEASTEPVTKENEESDSETTGAAIESEQSGFKGGDHRGNAGGPGSMGGMQLDKSADTELQDMIAEVADKFTQGEYTDEETGKTVPYNIYLPENYDSSRTYPMVVFIGDATTVGADMSYPLTQGWGGLIWASDEVQNEVECIVLVPVYPETVIDDNNGAELLSDYIDLTPRMIQSVADQYSVDTNRIYGTGQSMGAMTTMYLAANVQDLYAGVLIVDGQWDTAALAGLSTQNVMYVVAGGDDKAFEGQSNVKSMLNEQNVTYGEVSDLDAQADREELNEAIETMLAEGHNINFVTWTSGSVREGVSSNINSEHMASFDYGYKLSSIRDWLLSQSKSM